MATECPYCGNPAIIKERVSGSLRPDYIIPFRLDRQAAKDTLKKFYKGKLLLPKAFRRENTIDKLQGVYVPFWLFDCDANGTVHFNTTRVSSWRSGDYLYTKTSHFLVIRGGKMAFEKIPVDASEKMDDSYMDSLEPFDYRSLTDFGTAYLSGFLADRFDVSAKDSSPARVPAGEAEPGGHPAVNRPRLCHRHHAQHRYPHREQHGQICHAPGVRPQYQIPATSAISLR